ncbi:MAG: class IV adenylate cyclase [Pirellula sp.]
MQPDYDSPMEAECKYRVESIDETRRAIVELKANFIGHEQHCDTYLRHPSRNFRDTDEALRIREIDGKPFVTYKGPRLAGPMKIRPEIELPLVSNTVDDWLKIWGHLGFSIALAVRKSRDVYQLAMQTSSVTITLDHVESLGDFVEIERIVRNQEEIESAQRDIQDVAKRLRLSKIESRSYLGMLLERG